MTQFELFICYSDPSQLERAENLSKKLNLPLKNNAAYCLYVSQDKLSLNIKGFAPLSVDFTDGSLKKRLDEGKKQGLVRACKPRKGMQIIDVTAGWGHDAALLAGFGAEVFMIERNPVMAVLLEDGLRRVLEMGELQLSLLHADSMNYLKTLKRSSYPEVIYMDPMHPKRTKSALVKKEMQSLQQLIGCDEDAQQLLQIARHRVKERVVVKWPQKIRSLMKPDYSIPGKTVRFDVYCTSAGTEE